jgi:Galactosyltransferase
MISKHLFRLKVRHFVFVVLLMLLGLSFLFAITSSNGFPEAFDLFDYTQNPTECDEKAFQSALDDLINAEIFPSTNLILVGVFSIASRFHRRSLIRISYLKFKPAQVTFKFVIGKPKDYAELALVRLENEMYNDILILPIEENMNRGKTFDYFSKIVQGSSKFVFIMKADDDIYINFPQLLFQFRSLPKQQLYWGREIDAGKRTSFMGGSAYALSWDAALAMANSKECHAKRFMAEDQFVAACMRFFRIPTTSVTPESGIIDEPVAKLGWSAKYSSGNIVVHQLKRNDWFLKAYSYFNNNTCYVLKDPKEKLKTA